jgi:lysozyme family protein
MKQNFNDCLNRVLKHEGGYTNDPSDSGGATNFGITIADYRMYIKKDGTPNDVRNMKLEDAKRIYKTKYWDAVGGDTLSSGVDYTVFDYAVNSGVGRARKVLQQFKSLQGSKLIDAINDERMAFLRNLAVRRPKDQKFLRGWTIRVTQVRGHSHALAGRKPDVVSGPISGATAGLGLFGMMYQYMQTHPYMTAAIAIGGAAAIWYVVHYLRNRK